MNRFARNFIQINIVVYILLLFASPQNAIADTCNPLVISNFCTEYRCPDDTSRQLFAYDSRGNVVERIELQRNGTAWQYLWKYDFLYDTSSQLDTTYSSKWDSVAGAWCVDPTRVCFAYNDKGFLTQKLIETKAGDIWDNGARVLYSYDTLGHLAIELLQNWNYIAGTQQLDWVNFSQWLFSYNSSGLLDTSVNQNWDTAINAWNDYARHLFEYDTAGRLSADIVEMRDPSWQEWWRTSFTYTADGDTAQRLIHKTYNGISNNVFTYTYLPAHRKIGELEVLDGTNRRRTTWLYNDAGCISRVITEIELSLTTQNLHGWDSAGVSIYEYAPLKAYSRSFRPINISDIDFYIRKSSLFIHISNKHFHHASAIVQIYNLSGRVLGNCQLTAKGLWIFPISVLPAGEFIIAASCSQSNMSRIIHNLH